MRRFMKRSLHDKVLIIVTAIALLAVIVGIMGVEGDLHEISVGMITGGLLWLYLFTYANAR